MKNTLKLAVFAVLALLVSLPAFAQQNTLTGTTLAAAVTDSATTVRVASATGITSSSSTTSTFIYVDNELMPVISVSGTTLTVSRGASGTRAAAHVSGAVVYAGRPNWFYVVNPQGTCSLSGATAILVTPYINVNTGNQFLCSSILGKWVAGFGNPGNSAVPAGVVTAVASQAGATTITGPLFHMTGTNAITSFTIPVGGVGQNFCIIPDGAYTTVAGNNIAISTTGVANKTQCWTWDGTNSKYTASY